MPPLKNWPKELKIASRTRSEVGRTSSGIEASRRPRAKPAIILTALLSEQPLDVFAKEILDLTP